MAEALSWATTFLSDTRAFLYGGDDIVFANRKGSVGCGDHGGLGWHENYGCDKKDNNFCHWYNKPSHIAAQCNDIIKSSKESDATSNDTMASITINSSKKHENDAAITATTSYVGRRGRW